ncbi:MAG: tetratricopeptide repeat protein [Chthonomonadales bacterium]
MNSAALIRYNFRVVMFRSWWLLVFPIAVSQLTVFWTLVTQRAAPTLPAQSAEMVTPIVAAFLAAHLLAPEYPARLGAILACKPLNLPRLVLMRLAAVLAFVWILQALTLAAFYASSGPYNVAAVVAASLPSTLFLAVLALTMATLFRQPMAGFGIAALYWAFDLVPGPVMNPYLSLRAYSLSIPVSGIPMGDFAGAWWVSKGILLAAALLLYRIHSSLIFRLGAPTSTVDRRRALIVAAGLAAVYILTAATTKVVYGYTHRGALVPSDGAWFRSQFSTFGPLPVADLFGPAFRRYLGEVPSAWRVSQEGEEDLLGATPKHIRDLRTILDRMPNSIWAPSAAEMLARMIGRKQKTLEDRVRMFRSIVDRYPDSPYVAWALEEIAQAYDQYGMRSQAVAAYAELLKRRPNSVYQAEALRYLVGTARQAQDWPTAERWAREWLKVAPLYERPVAAIELAEILQAKGDTQGAKDYAGLCLDAGKAFFDAMRTNSLPGSASSQLKWQREVEAAVQRARAIQGKL